MATRTGFYAGVDWVGIDGKEGSSHSWLEAGNLLVT